MVYAAGTMNVEHHREQLPVFVYGTLRPGQKNYRRYLQGRTSREEPALCRGRLYFIAEGGYPYLTPEEGDVRGELLTLHPATYQQTLAALDDLEEYSAQDEAGSLYLRRIATVRAGVREVPAWVYYWHGTTSGVRIESGDFEDRQ
jgi:gamma-glutamylcyclotransferase (GGCT)/AIG2-like uncharacterized protein YtfP